MLDFFQNSTSSQSAVNISTQFSAGTKKSMAEHSAPYNVIIERRAAFARPVHDFCGRTRMPCYESIKPSLVLLSANSEL